MVQDASEIVSTSLVVPLLKSFEATALRLAYPSYSTAAGWRLQLSEESEVLTVMSSLFKVLILYRRIRIKKAQQSIPSAQSGRRGPEVRVTEKIIANRCKWLL